MTSLNLIHTISKSSFGHTTCHTAHSRRSPNVARLGNIASVLPPCPNQHPQGTSSFEHQVPTAHWSYSRSHLPCPGQPPITHPCPNHQYPIHIWSSRACVTLRGHSLRVNMFRLVLSRCLLLTLVGPNRQDQRAAPPYMPHCHQPRGQNVYLLFAAHLLAAE